MNEECPETVVEKIRLKHCAISSALADNDCRVFIKFVPLTGEVAHSRFFPHPAAVFRLTLYS